jgi:hypothetical protein
LGPVARFKAIYGLDPETGRLLWQQLATTMLLLVDREW